MFTPGIEDRAAGAMVGSACGDALGAGYEFSGPFPDSFPVTMKGGGPFGFAPGEWTDDTSMAVPLLQLAAGSLRLRNRALSRVVIEWRRWARTAPDVGNQTRAVLEGMADPEADGCMAHETADPWVHPWTGLTGYAEALAWATAADYQRRHPDSAGNGSLMRSTPFGIVGARQGEDNARADYVGQQSMLTHPHRDAVEACIIWSAAIGHAIRTGELDVRRALDPERLLIGQPSDQLGAQVPPDQEAPAPEARRALWLSRIEEAEAHRPEHFTRNGWVVQALQGAWSAIAHSGRRGDDDPHHLRRALEMAVRGGNDTDTVAAIAGGLIGGAYGMSAIPAAWTRKLHGWPGWRADDLARRAFATLGMSGGMGWDYWDEEIDRSGWKKGARGAHPHDSGVYVGNYSALGAFLGRWGSHAAGEAVVSLCPTRRADIPEDVAHDNRAAIWFPDLVTSSESRIDFAFREAADAVASLRAEGNTVLVHCMDGMTRTPSVAVLYAVRHLGVPLDEAWTQVLAVLRDAKIDPRHRAAVERVAREERPGV